MELKEWLNKGEGGEWYESYVTNRDLMSIGVVITIVCAMFITCCWLLSKFYYL